MTKPTISYGHGFCDDGNDITAWDPSGTGTKVLTNMTDGQTSITVENDDYFKVTGVCDSTDDESVYFENDITNLSSTVYTKYLVRWKTTDSNGVGISSNGCGARIQLVFTSGSPQDLLESNGVPQFSSTWTVTSGTITSGKIIDKVRIWADDYPDSIASGTYYVYVDFILLYKDNFEFPNVGYGLEFKPPTCYAILAIPGRISDIIQNLGSESATVACTCDLDIGRLSTTSSTCTGDDWKRPQGVDAEYQTDYIKAQVFYDIAHNNYTEPFQWLNTGLGQQFKVTLENPIFHFDGAEHRLDLLFREYSRSSKSNETYVERFGLNL